MKRLTCLMLILVLAGSGSLQAQQSATTEAMPRPAELVDPVSQEVRLEASGMSITELLSSRDDQLRQIALRSIIRDGHNMEFSHRDVDRVVRLMQTHGNKNIRRMAVVALSNMHDEWAMGVIARMIAKEHVPQVRHTMAAVLYGPAVPSTDVPMADSQIARKGE